MFENPILKKIYSQNRETSVNQAIDLIASERVGISQRKDAIEELLTKNKISFNPNYVLRSLENFLRHGRNFPTFFKDIGVDNRNPILNLKMDEGEKYTKEQEKIEAQRKKEVLAAERERKRLDLIERERGLQALGDEPHQVYPHSISQQNLEELNEIRSNLQRLGVTEAELSRTPGSFPTDSRVIAERQPYITKAKNLASRAGIPSREIPKIFGSDVPRPLFYNVRRSTEVSEGADGDERSQTGESGDSEHPSSEWEFPELSEIDQAAVQHVPKWQQQARKKFIERAVDLAKDPWKSYPGQRVAEPSPEQEAARNVIHGIVLDEPQREHYDRARSILQSVVNDRIAPRMEGERQHGAGAVTPSEIESYYSPYQNNVIRSFQNKMTRHFIDDVINPLEARLIGSGAYNTGARRHKFEKARDRFAEILAEKVGELEHAGFKESLAAAQDEKRRRLAGISAAEQLHGRDISSQLDASERLLRSAQEENLDKVRNINMAAALGAEEQAREQQKINVAYQDFLQQKAHPHEQLARAAAIERGIEPQRAVFGYQASVPPIHQGPNPYTQLGGHLIGLAGQMGRMQTTAYKGGRVHKADGGGIISDALKDMREQSIQEALMRADQLEKKSVSPFWNFLAHAGPAMAASQNPNALGALNEGMVHGWQGVTEADHENAARKDQSQSLREAVLKSLELEEKRKYERKRQEERDKLEDLLKREDLNLKRERLSHERERHSAQDSLNKMYKEAQINHLGSKESTSFHEGIRHKGMTPESIPYIPEKLTAKETDFLLKQQEKVESIPHFLKKLDEMKKKNAEASEIIGPIAGSRGDEFWATVGKINPTIAESLVHRQEFNKLSKDFVTELGMRMKGNPSFARINLAHESLPNQKNDPRANEYVIEELKGKLEPELESANLYSEYKGRIPFDSLKRYVKNYIDKKYYHKDKSQFNQSFEQFIGIAPVETESSHDEIPKNTAPSNSNKRQQLIEAFKAKGLTFKAKGLI